MQQTAILYVDMADRWCYIIKHSAELTAEQVKHLSQHGETKMALEHLEEVSKEEREFWNAMSRERHEWEYQWEKQGMIAEGMEIGRVQGIQEGRVQGIDEGRVEGMERGREQGMHEGRAQGVYEGLIQGTKKGMEER